MLYSSILLHSYWQICRLCKP